MTEYMSTYAAKKGLMLPASVPNSDVDIIEREIWRFYKRGIRDAANFLRDRAADFDAETQLKLQDFEKALRQYALNHPNHIDAEEE